MRVTSGENTWNRKGADRLETNKQTKKRQDGVKKGDPEQVWRETQVGEERKQEGNRARNSRIRQQTHKTHIR